MENFSIEGAIRADILSMEKCTAPEQLENRKYVKLNANENPFPLLQEIRESIIQTISSDSLNHYPDSSSLEVRRAAERVFEIPSDRIIVGNGSAALLDTIFRTLLNRNEKVGAVVPTFTLYKEFAQRQGASIQGIPLPADCSLPITDLLQADSKFIILPNPNVPIGNSFPMSDVEELLKNYNRIVVLDEAYAEFAGKSGIQLVKEYPNLIVTKSLSKACSMAGVRVGLGFSSKEIIEQLNKVRVPNNVGRITQAAAIAALNNWQQFQVNIDEIIAEREKSVFRLRERGFRVLQSDTNFLLAEVPIGGVSATEWRATLKQEGILIRTFQELPKHIRISIGSAEDMQLCFDAVDKILSTKR